MGQFLAVVLRFLIPEQRGNSPLMCSAENGSNLLTSSVSTLLPDKCTEAYGNLSIEQQ